MSSSGGDGQLAMMVVWLAVVLVAAGGAGVYALARRRKARRP